MNITYTGIRGNASWKGVRKNQIRLATICYDENSARDCQMTEFVTRVLQINGWPVPNVNVSGSFEIEVADKAEYEDLVQDYKAAKHAAALDAKFFPRKSRLCTC